MQFLMSPELEALVQSFKLPKTSSDNLDFSKLNTDQYYQFRHAFVEQRMHNPTYQANKGGKAMDLILSVLCMVLCNKVPKGLVSFRTEPLAHKIKLITPPRGVEVHTRTVMEKDQQVVIEKNTNEKALVRIIVPKRTMTLSEYN